MKDMDERLYEAAIRGDVEMLLDLLNEDVLMQADEPFLDRVMRDCIGKDNLLHLGAHFGHVEFVRVISSRKPEFARQLNSQGLSPLHLAAERGHVQVVKVLLGTDVDVCFVRDRNGRIPLHLAAIKGRIEVIEELVKAKSITAWLLTDEREPILHLCAKHDQFDALKKLVSLVNDDGFVGLKDSNDNTILHILAAKLQTMIMKFLLDNTNIEQEINALNVQKHTALDELYEAQWEAGYFLPNKNFLGDGAKRSSDLSSIGVGQPTYFTWWRTRPDGKWLAKIESSYMVLSVLIATVTYQAVFNPPGGIWQDDYPPPGSDKVKDDPRKHHKAGMPILSDKGPLQFEVFCMFNSMGFVGSAAMILNMVIRRQVPPTCLTFITLTSWICAYLSASFSTYQLALPPIFLAVEYFVASKIAGLVIKGRRRQREAEVTQQSVVIQTSTDRRNC
ncbi:ankyrin repeat-containing protein NPR4-like protein [Cinnamomum micranthum f. kanehirae]|uniref:Ankyrin repeat-containing protein NPR4-like protein n=1 Tax=Cinnamomum micranthum f. kanehirae TaxID=337451 RepID=A0A3S3N631_9MAGN|nr:ankyrin repeat-containing protein NPR4-like protein [Cinnamomum micranthum f. kanehirae]